MRPIHKIFPDAKMPTDLQRERLCRMLFNALIEIRILGWQGKAEQAADLADAFHNLPIYIWSEDFSLDFFRKFLESYQKKHKNQLFYNYLKMLDQIDEEKFDW